MTNHKDKSLLSNCKFFYFVFQPSVCKYGQALGRRRRAIQEIPVKAGKLVAPLLQKGLLLLLLILTTEKQRALEREKMEKGHSPSQQPIDCRQQYNAFRPSIYTKTCRQQSCWRRNRPRPTLTTRSYTYEEVYCQQQRPLAIPIVVIVALILRQAQLSKVQPIESLSDP